MHVEARGGGRFRIHNRQHFTSLERYRGEWELTVDGDAAQGRPAAGAARSGRASRWTSTLTLPRGNGERFVTFRFRQRAETHWAPAGFTVAHQQLPLPGRAPRAPGGRAVRASDDGVLESGRVRAVIDLDLGELWELALDGQNVLADGSRLQLWRAPTDNDGLPQVPSRLSGVLPRWLELGLDRLEPELVSAGVSGPPSSPCTGSATCSRTGIATGCSRPVSCWSRTSSSSRRGFATCRESAPC